MATARSPQPPPEAGKWGREDRGHSVPLRTLSPGLAPLLWKGHPARTPSTTKLGGEKVRDTGCAPTSPRLPRLCSGASDSPGQPAASGLPAPGQPRREGRAPASTDGRPGEAPLGTSRAARGCQAQAHRPEPHGEATDQAGAGPGAANRARLWPGTRLPPIHQRPAESGPPSPLAPALTPPGPSASTQISRSRVRFTWGLGHPPRPC